MLHVIFLVCKKMWNRSFRLRMVFILLILNIILYQQKNTWDKYLCIRGKIYKFCFCRNTM